MTTPPIAFYYGAGEVERLIRYQRVVLQPDFYSPAELSRLREAGVQPLAYLSLSEDQGPPAPWQRPERNPDWGGAFVYVGHPGWVEHMTKQARAALEAGFAGLFLDTLNVEFTFPEDVPHLIALIATLRELAGTAYILANRGFAMLPRLVELVDGILFESFSVRWVDTGYAPWPPDVLESHARMAEQLLEFDFDLYALDYAESEGLAAFAARRARQFSLHSFVSDRALSRVQGFSEADLEVIGRFLEAMTDAIVANRRARHRQPAADVTIQVLVDPRPVAGSVALR